MHFVSEASKHAKGLSQKDNPKWVEKGKLVKNKKNSTVSKQPT